MRSPLLRKLRLLRRQIPRAQRRLSASPEAYERTPPVVANSFPKSGTHLLLQLLQSLPNTTHYGSFIATTPTITFTERSLEAHARLVSRIAPGELVAAHLYYDPQHAALLAGKRCVHYFIYRDPRDVVVSEAHYLTRMNRWHRLHRYFRRLPSDDDRISFSILGNAAQPTPFDYPDVARRFERYRGWLGREDVMALKYEDLVSDRRADTVRRMVRYYLERTGPIADPDDLVRRALANVDGPASHTFRSGKVGGWRDAFGAAHRREMKRVAGDLLIDLGYEASLEW